MDEKKTLGEAIKERPNFRLRDERLRPDLIGKVVEIRVDGPVNPGYYVGRLESYIVLTSSGDVLFKLVGISNAHGYSKNDTVQIKVY